MKNMLGMMDMMKKAQAMQSQMAIIQNKMENTEFTGTAGNGAVQITMTGKFKATHVKLEPSVVSQNDKETLEDLILVAINDAKQKADDAMVTAFEGVKKNLGLPENFKLPF